MPGTGAAKIPAGKTSCSDILFVLGRAFETGWLTVKGVKGDLYGQISILLSNEKDLQMSVSSLLITDSLIFLQ